MKKAALVTGAAKRIGQAIALDLASQGYDIALHYHHSEIEARTTAVKIRKLKRRCELFPGNLASQSDVSSLLKNVLQEFPYLSVLMNSASVFEKSQLRTSSLEFFNKQFAVNFQTPYILSQEFAKHCRSGQIISLLDTHITDYKTSYSDYLLTKKLLAEFTKLAACEFAPGIRVNAVAPGLILPPEGKRDDYLKRLALNIPLKRKGTPRHITQAVRFLIENDYVTGQIIFVDGGEHLI